MNDNCIMHTQRKCSWKTSEFSPHHHVNHPAMWLRFGKDGDWNGEVWQKRISVPPNKSLMWFLEDKNVESPIIATPARTERGAFFALLPYRGLCPQEIRNHIYIYIHI